jgi:hypothetical protein
MGPGVRRDDDERLRRLRPVNSPVTSFVYALPTIRLSSNGPIGERVCKWCV